MPSLKARIVVGSVMTVGLVLWGAFAKKLNNQGRFDYEPNVACIKGSPYGKVVALAMQGSIDFYWHKGTTHEHADALGEDHDHGPGGHTHGPGGHMHGPGGHTHGHGEHSHGAGGHDFETVDSEGGESPKQNRVVVEVKEPLRVRAKEKLRKMAATAHRRTDNKPLSRAHVQYIQDVTEDKLKLAYELDPSNYANYGNYHLFIATTSFGREAYNDAAAVKLARKTLNYCKQDNIDPASWVTAASAAYNIIYHIGRYHEHFSVAEAKASLAEFDYCIRRYNQLLGVAVKEERILSEIRYNEMSDRVRYLSMLRQAQGEYMKRMMSAKEPNKQ